LGWLYDEIQLSNLLQLPADRRIVLPNEGLLEAILVKAIKKDPQERYPTVNDFMSELNHWHQSSFD